ncbi:WD40/YVTN_repeat-like-containing domain superfamily [Hexamita inflata]|uniref:WD40/YVTN repeat-like-containing domain superfamily n=1 Tax=Hexamita inflata TaxID=28002 RepID=A0AA86QWD3_9EUKA|nr:WD40/YVTN repeat-like-containing domain superfamily [Hexamita inflata]CAI9964432.1 WD40/YVTN repeat-like-containing domain superfamily [Hexamita inflata]
MKQISAQKPHALQLPKLQRKEPEIHIEHNNMDFEVEQQETWEKYLVANPKNLLRKPIVPRILTRPSSVQLSFRNAQIDQSFQMSYQTKPHFQTTSVFLSTRFCVSTGFDGKTVIHDLLNQTQNAIQSSYPVFCSKVDDNVNSNLFAYGSLYGNVHVTNFNGDEIFSANTDSAILSLDFKQKLAVGTESGMCVIYDIERKTQQKLIQHYAEVVQMQIEGNLCYTAGFDGVVNRNDLRAHAEETEGLHNFESSLISHKSPIIKMKIVNNKLLTASSNQIKVFDLRNNSTPLFETTVDDLRTADMNQNCLAYSDQKQTAVLNKEYFNTCESEITCEHMQFMDRINDGLICTSSSKIYRIQKEEVHEVHSIQGELAEKPEFNISALSMGLDGKNFAIGRLIGSLELFD